MTKKLQPIIIKRIKKSAHAHHGGAWKIAYADFVTAMMAFFLLMWLLGSTAQGDLQGIASYFNSPLKVEMAGGPGSGSSSSIVTGGGTDLTRTNGQVKRSSDGKGKDNGPLNEDNKRGEQARQDARRMNSLRAKIDSMIEANPKLREFRSQIRLNVTIDGLEIQIVDDKNRPMFDSGSALVKPYMREILHEIAPHSTASRTASAWPDTPTPRPTATANAATETGNSQPIAPTHRGANWSARACPTTNWCAWSVWLRAT